MANTISTAFQAEYGTDVKQAFQRQGSLLLGTVRRKTGVNGSTHIFQTLGKGTATSKSRNGLIIPMNPLHGTATATLVDQYAPEYVDKLDEEKIGYDERAELVNLGAWALGRAADQQIIDALDGSTTYDVAVGVTDFTLAKAVEALYENLFTRDVMDDGNVTFLIGPQQFGDLMSIQQFASADYIGGGTAAMMGGSSGKRWLNCNWIMHSGLTKVGNVRTCFVYHKLAIGHASGHEISTEINYIPERVAHLVTSMMSMGAILVDAEGVTHIHCDETA
jgi:hypothetical protein